MAKVEGTMQDFTQWALDTLIIALEVNDQTPANEGRWRKNSATAREQLDAIFKEVNRIGDKSQTTCRQVAIRVVRLAAARINDGILTDAEF